MLDIYLSLFGLYFFVLAGFFLKKKFSGELHQKSLVLVSVYLSQPVLGFWGFSKAPLSWDIVNAGWIYFLSSFIVMGVLVFGTKFFIQDSKMQAVLCFTGTSGNTGNIGIPLGGIFAGPTGIVIATMINFWNILWNFIFGVFFYAKGEYSLKKSLIEIVKIPVLWASVFGIFCNLIGISFSEKTQYFLEIGAYSAIFLQLLLLGIFFAGITISSLNIQVNAWVSFVKFTLLPIAGFVLLLVFQKFFGEISTAIMTITLMQLCTPIATNNANLATLYNCYPSLVAEVTFWSYVIFFCLSPPVFFFLTQ